MFKIGKGNQIMWLFLGLIFLLVCVIIIKYTVEGFAASECKFIKLGDYNLSSDATVKAGISSYGTKKGLIYVPTGSVTFSDMQYQKPGDTNYSYISLTKTDINNIDVFVRIKSIMACHGVPEFSNTIGINSKPALILCLQSNSGTISRTFFIKCFVPKTSSTSDDSNVIVGEIAGNTRSSVYTSTIKPVSLIQSSVGTPNILPATPVTGTDYSYSLSYVICPSATRPEGFSYTDCCSPVSDSIRIIPSSWTDLDITDSTKCPASATATSSTTTTIPPATKSKGCGSYPDDSSCPIPFCSLDNKKGACSGAELLRDSSTGKYLDPDCKVGSYSDYGGRLQTICTGSTNTIRNDTGSNNLDIYKLLRDRSQYHNWVENPSDTSGDSEDTGYSGTTGDRTGKNWFKNSWFSGGKWQNNWNGDTSNIPKNSYTSNKDELLKKNELLEQRLARLEGQMILNNPTDEVCDDACEYPVA